MPNLRIKGQSELTSIVLMVAIVILLMTIIYSPIKKLAESPLLSPESCQEIKDKQALSIRTSCYTSKDNSLEVTIIKNSEEPLDSLIFKLEFENETKSWKCGPDCIGCKVLDRGSKTYHFFPNRIPRTVTITVNGCSLATREVTPCQ